MLEGEQRKCAANFVAGRFGAASTVVEAVAGIGNANKAAARLVGQDTLVELVSLLNRHNTVFGAVEKQKRRRRFGNRLVQRAGDAGSIDIAGAEEFVSIWVALGAL